MKEEEECDGFLILVRNQTWLLQLLEAALAVRDQPASCTPLPARPPLVSGCISDELFCCSDGSTLAGAESLCFIFLIGLGEMTAAGLFMVFSFHPPHLQDKCLGLFFTSRRCYGFCRCIPLILVACCEVFYREGENKPGQFIFNSDMV